MKRNYKIILLVLFLTLFFGMAGGTWAGQQTSYTAAQTIIDNARNILKETTASFWTDASLLIYLNMGVQDIASKTGCLDLSYTVTLSSGTSEYSIESGTSYFAIKTAIYQSGTSTFKGLKQGNPQSMGHAAQNIGEPVFWYAMSDKIGIYPSPASSGNTVYALLSQRPISIGLTNTIPLPALYDNTLTFWIVAMALFEDRKMQLGNNFMTLYSNDIKYYATAYEIWPFKTVEEIIK